MISKVLIFNNQQQQQQEITNSYTDIISTHEPNSYAIHISITNQFENNITEVDLRAYYVFRGAHTIEQFIRCLIHIQGKYKGIKKT